jgi:hypothetical protein
MLRPCRLARRCPKQEFFPISPHDASATKADRDIILSPLLAFAACPLFCSQPCFKSLCCFFLRSPVNALAPQIRRGQFRTAGEPHSIFPDTPSPAYRIANAIVQYYYGSDTSDDMQYTLLDTNGMQAAFLGGAILGGGGGGRGAGGMERGEMLARLAWEKGLLG